MLSCQQLATYGCTAFLLLIEAPISQIACCQCAAGLCPWLFCPAASPGLLSCRVCCLRVWCTQCSLSILLLLLADWPPVAAGVFAASIVACPPRRALSRARLNLQPSEATPAPSTRTPLPLRPSAASAELPARHAACLEPAREQPVSCCSHSLLQANVKVAVLGSACRCLAALSIVTAGC